MTTQKELFEAMPEAWHRRRMRLRAVLAGRRTQLEHARITGEKYFDVADKYDRAHKAWRKWRWGPDKQWGSFKPY
jgi:hypothetical protein